VHGDHLLANVAEHRDRGAAPAHVRPRPPLGGHRAAEQHRTVLVRLRPGVEHPRLHRRGRRAGQPQPPLDHCPARLRAHPPRVGAPAEEQPQPGDDHRLARAGLAGDHVHPVGKRQRGVLDDAEPGDA
jgi:hypothetical protein